MYNLQLEDVINYETLNESIELCSKGLMWKPAMCRYYSYSDFRINSLYNKFYTVPSTYRFDKLYHTVINERGTQRLISSTTVKDRVVQKAFNRHFLLPTFVPTYIYDNAASLVGKGTSFALDRMQLFIHNAYLNYGTNFYVMKLDIRHFFDTMYHPYILEQIKHYTNDIRIIDFFAKQLWMFQKDPMIHNGEDIPAGVGLGRECDQSFGLITLSGLDHLAKEHFQFKYYERYMDDIIILSNDLNKLNEVYKYFDEYVHKILHMEFNQNKSMIIPMCPDGFIFLKVHFILESDGHIHRKVCKKTVKRFRSKLQVLAELLNNNIISYSDIRCYYSSIKGTLLKADSYNELSALNQLYDTLVIYNWFPDDWKVLIDEQDKRLPQNNI